MRSPSLRRRILGAYLLLALVVSACFAFVTVRSLLSVEDRIMHHRLRRTADALIPIDASAAACRIPETPKVLHGAELAPELRQLGLGIHELNLGGSTVQVLIRDWGGERYAVVEDVSRFHRIELRVLYSLAAAFAMALLGGVVLGLVTVSRVIAPLTRLANDVENGKVVTESELHASRDELGQLARAFARHSEQLNAVLAREQLFTGDVSHELRTPLTVILGAAEVLEARLRDDRDLLQVALRIRRTAEDASAQVNAMLLLSRAPETIEASDVDLVPIVRGLLERSAPLVEHKPVQLRFTAEDAQVLVRARPELASIAIGNLIRNACHFTEAGEVRVHVGRGRVTVEDTGPGIPVQIREGMFERHVSAMRPGSHGAGLGLSIVKRVAEHLGWRVSVEHLPQEGTRFELAFVRSHDVV